MCDFRVFGQDVTFSLIFWTFFLNFQGKLILFKISLGKCVQKLWHLSLISPNKNLKRKFLTATQQHLNKCIILANKYPYFQCALCTSLILGAIFRIFTWERRYTLEESFECFGNFVSSFLAAVCVLYPERTKNTNIGDFERLCVKIGNIWHIAQISFKISWPICEYMS